MIKRKRWLSKSRDRREIIVGVVSLDVMLSRGGGCGIVNNVCFEGTVQSGVRQCFYTAPGSTSSHLNIVFQITAEDVHLIYKFICKMTDLVANCIRGI